MEVAHRLTKTPGKCLQIHGHSMWLELEFWADVDETGKVGGMEFGLMKARFRSFIDTAFDHHLLLSTNDPLLKEADGLEPTTRQKFLDSRYPGLTECRDDPTVENLAKWIGLFGLNEIGPNCSRVRCSIQETRVNLATWEWTR